MKQLIVIIGPNGAGKSTTARNIVERYENTAYVDSDWCRVMNPFNFTEITKETIAQNIYSLLYNYLSCDVINTIIFTYGWHGARKEIYEKVIGKLKSAKLDFEEKIVILKCSKEENIKRAINDGRNEERVKRGMDLTFAFYDEYAYPMIDTTDMIPSRVADRIMDFVKEQRHMIFAEQ